MILFRIQFNQEILLLCAAIREACPDFRRVNVGRETRNMKRSQTANFAPLQAAFMITWPRRTTALLTGICRPVRFPPSLSSNSNFPSRSSKMLTSASLPARGGSL